MLRSTTTAPHNGRGYALPPIKGWLGGVAILSAGTWLTHEIDGLPVEAWDDLNAYLQEKTEVGQTVTLALLARQSTA